MASTKTAKKVKQVVKLHGKPEDHHMKTYVSGKKMSEHGTAFHGHRLAMKALRERHVAVKLK